MPVVARIERITKPELNLSGKQVFLHQDYQIVASGAALRLSATGEERTQKLADGWRQVIADAQVVDESDSDSPGLIALTSITFDSQSKEESILVVPAETFVLSDKACFRITAQAEEETQSVQGVHGEFRTGLQTDEKFLSSVESALAAIEKGQIEKVVLAKDLILPISSEPDLGEPLRRLHKRYPDCWTYKIGNVFGASPELLLKAEDGQVSARVLAGTAGRGTDPDVDKAIADGLAHSLKNKHEHLYAVQSLVSELEPFCENVEFDEEPFSLALPDLWHLATDVRGTLKPQFTLLDVIQKLHPTAAVAGTPREQAITLIRELEPFDRGGYAGPVGWLSSNGSGEIAIALRGGVIEENQIRAIAGCGIVSESTPQAELDETELKFKAVRWAFQSTSS
jgi:menaquinone-specific isochorismate synthase